MRFFKSFFIPLILISSFLLCSKTTFAQTEIIAFPTADGFGKFTKGARGNPNVAPQIVKVTNLNDSGVGSLRWALTRPFPRFVVFDVTGIIELQSNITISEPYLTVAGQTAPGIGITLKNNGLRINTSEVIIRGLKLRVGDEGTPSNDLRGIAITTTGATSNVTNIIVDHVSATWGVDTNFDTWQATVGGLEVRNVTLQWSIFAEALYDSIHIDEINGPQPHSMGGMLGRGTNRNISFHHNLMSNNNDRNPRIDGVTNVEVVNNVLYNWGPASIGGGPTKFSNAHTQAHVIKNYYKNTSTTRPIEIQLGDNMDLTSRVYYTSPGNENILDHFQQNLIPIRIDNINYTVLTMIPRFTSLLTDTQSATEASLLVFENVGAMPRDEVDTRIVSDVENRTGEIIDSPSEVGGWPVHPQIAPLQDSDSDGIPDVWEQSNPPMDPFVNDSLQDHDADGYLNIEEYINSYFETPNGDLELGDANGDGDVDGEDYVIWLNHYNQPAQPNDYSVGNFNSDEIVDGLDYVIWLNNYS